MSFYESFQSARSVEASAIQEIECACSCKTIHPHERVVVVQVPGKLKRPIIYHFASNDCRIPVMTEIQKAAKKAAQHTA